MGGIFRSVISTCGVIILSLQGMALISEKNLTLGDVSEKILPGIYMLFWFFGLRYFNAKYIKKEEENG